MKDVQRVVAVDWSGDRSVAGQRKKIWAGVWTAGGRLRLESKMTRETLIDWLIEMARDTPRMVVGVDFCFSYPAWFVAEHGAKTAPEFWEIVVEHGERWLGWECEDARFWGRVGKFRTGKKPLEFCGEFGLRMLRQADIACKVQGKILDPSEAAKVKGIAPKSPFQIGGAGAVGTGTLRGIPKLPELVKGGFSIWPFHPTRLPMLVEIYPRLLTGEVKKGDAKERAKYLMRKQKEEAAYSSIEEDVMEKARESEDAFDALVSVMEMVARRDDFPQLPQSTDAVTLLEGAVWGAKT
ncbi:MAG: hypothetical protein ABSG84_07555 [Acidobacteriaceae bacterium]